jgi:hypothetical protein
VTVADPRTAEVRKADTLAKLRAREMDVWVSSASASGAYLVPLSLAWIGDRVVLALAANSRTARNIVESGAARLALGPTRDVVIIDAVLEQSVGLADASVVIAEGYASQADWDPRTAGEGYVFLVLRPERIQAWRESNELPGRTLMRAGSWIV